MECGFPPVPVAARPRSGVVGQLTDSLGAQADEPSSGTSAAGEGNDARNAENLPD